MAKPAKRRTNKSGSMHDLTPKGMKKFEQGMNDKMKAYGDGPVPRGEPRARTPMSPTSPKKRTTREI